MYNPTEYCSQTMRTTGLAVGFLPGSTKLNLRTIWKSSNIHFYLGSLYVTIIRLGYSQLLSVVLEVNMCSHEPNKKLYQIKTSTLEYYFSRLDFCSLSLILFIIGQQRRSLFHIQLNYRALSVYQLYAARFIKWNMKPTVAATIGVVYTGHCLAIQKVQHF